MEYSAKIIFQKDVVKAVSVLMIGGAFLFFLGKLASGNSQGESIEIISGGIKYESMETYREAEREKRESVSKIYETSVKYIQALLKNMQRHSQPPLNFLSAVPNIWNVNADQYPTLHKVDIGLEPIRSQSSEEDDKAYDPFLLSYVAISKIGFNTGVNKVIEDFQAEKGQTFPYKLLRKKDLEMVLSQSITENGYEGPVLLMSNKKKLRIMTLQSQEKNDISNMP